MAARWRAPRTPRSACSCRTCDTRREAEIERSGDKPFTTDELDVIELIANGYTDRAIARRLSVSVVTVRRRATSFRTKIGARNRAEAIAIAAGRGWVQHPAVRAAAGDE